MYLFYFPMFCFWNAENTVFDASQYAFFGDNVSEEVELGGLEDKEDYYPPVDYDDEEFLFNEEVTSCLLISVFNLFFACLV